MDVDADIVVTTQPTLPRVQAHPDTHRHVVRPGMCGESALRIGGCPDGCQRRWEDREHAVALGADLRTTMFGDRRPDERSMGFEDGHVCLAECRHQPGGAFDVRE